MPIRLDPALGLLVLAAGSDQHARAAIRALYQAAGVWSRLMKSFGDGPSAAR